jgi:hypothetical protein
MKSIKWIIGILIIIVGGIYGVNYVNLSKPVQYNLSQDERNEVVDIQVKYKYYIIPSTLVFNLKNVSEEAAAIDVFRVLLKTASSIQYKNFNVVELSYKGTMKFYIKGDYFQKIGKEYDEQNPVYTMRTLPENLFKPNGSHAYEKRTGGLLIVLSEQLEDFNDFCNKWFLDDLINEKNLGKVINDVGKKIEKKSNINLDRETDVEEAKVSVENVKMVKEYPNAWTVRGFIRNNDSQSIKGWVKIKFINSNGDIVHSYDAYVNGGDPVKPGQAGSFSYTTDPSDFNDIKEFDILFIERK